MIDRNQIDSLPASGQAAEILRRLGETPDPDVTPLVQLVVWAARRPDVRPDLLEKAESLPAADPADAVAMLVQDLPSLKEEVEETQQPYRALAEAMGAISRQLREEPDDERKAQGLLQNYLDNLVQMDGNYGMLFG